MTLEKIKGIIAEQLGVEEDAVKMETHLMKVPDEDAEKFQTVSDIVNYVEAKA